VQNTSSLHERAIPFGIRHGRVDGSDPQAAWTALQEAMAYVRTERRPFLLQADVARLYGHSSSSGARPESGRDCLAEYEAKLADQGLLSPQQAAQVHERWREHLRDAVHQVLEEPMPTKDDVFTHIYYREPD
jgi:2-oxoisovalerate dehydrogenase E1 component alpha subunit